MWAGDVRAEERSVFARVDAFQQAQASTCDGGQDIDVARLQGRFDADDLIPG